MNRRSLHTLRPASLPLPGVLLLMMLGGCGTTHRSLEHAPSTVDEQTRPDFMVAFQRTLQRDMATAIAGSLIGPIDLHITLDRRNALLGCKASRPRPTTMRAFPATLMPSSYKDLAEAVERQCWKSIYPQVPAALHEADGTIEVIAPLIMMPSPASQALDQRWRLNYAQREFFWQQLLLDHPVHSIGKAVIHFQADARGKVESCLVNLIPTAARPDAFEPDGNLQALLITRCKGLDLRQLPGFTLDALGKAQGSVSVEYAPWKTSRR